MVEAYQYRTYTAHTYSADIVQILRIPSLQNEVLPVACSDHIRMCSQLTCNRNARRVLPVRRVGLTGKARRSSASCAGRSSVARAHVPEAHGMCGVQLSFLANFHALAPMLTTAFPMAAAHGSVLM